MEEEWDSEAESVSEKSSRLGKRERVREREEGGGGREREGGGGRREKEGRDFTAILVVPQ